MLMNIVINIIVLNCRLTRIRQLKQENMIGCHHNDRGFHNAVPAVIEKCHFVNLHMNIAVDFGQWPTIKRLMRYFYWKFTFFYYYFFFFYFINLSHSINNKNEKCCKIFLSAENNNNVMILKLLISIQQLNSDICYNLINKSKKLIFFFSCCSKLNSLISLSVCVSVLFFSLMISIYWVISWLWLI